MHQDSLDRCSNRFQLKFLKHAGIKTVVSTLRSDFWIIGCRRPAKSVVRECISCTHDSRSCSQTVAPLLEFRAKPGPPFSVTGADFAVLC